MITQGFEGMVHKLCASARAGESDDRAAVSSGAAEPRPAEPRPAERVCAW